MFEILLPALVACWLLTGIHCYLGLHVLLREVIFVDLALAQLAAMGAAVALILGFAPDSLASYAVALAFSIAGAGLFALARFENRRIPQEAFIGIVYAVGSALTLLLYSKFALEKEEVENMLVGHLLFVDWREIGKTALLYGAIAALHLGLGKQFLALSRQTTQKGVKRTSRGLDFLFYASFGIVVTSSVKIAGVLLVFSFLIVPAACATLLVSGFAKRLGVGWILGALGSGLGVTASAIWDLPTGAAVVAALGLLFAIVASGAALRTKLSARSNASDTHS